MGPRLFSRGKEWEQPDGSCNARLLQWGRGFSAAERTPEPIWCRAA